ncbi:hypothetical protein SGQ44_12400 [Flavobacterium sp. Fl-77]|uniref:Uncharacterized protein n=1 Tax=Flavobacterium flavipigmentatum TaxID=2893884 RepID=A0AAJ2W1R8_9FLAO|nr:MULTISPECIES: hypothetical protein [unclassified Flavobacterium]MDX6183281.1 hypothetical protein [Flavobacterium sp. Fl-33]MDX6186565.1 hypothetical protein [Flavobacterium sp. Fl-77]UFH38665.1 hypothetical protein LNP22_18325 [Flavobacterium sp. F-70]
MEQYLRQLISIGFTDKKEIFTGFLIDYSDDWILLKNNPVDFIIDGFVILRNKNIEAIERDQELEFTEKVIRMKGLKTNADDIIPIRDLASIIHFITAKYGIFQIAKKSAKSAYLGKLIELNDEELTIDFLDTKGYFGGELSFNPEKIRVIEFDTDYINSFKLVVAENEN